MRRLAVTLSLFFIFVALLYGAQVPKKTGKKKPNPATQGNNFNLECAKLPFDAIATKPDPFAQCGNCGVVSDKALPAEVAAKAAQSHAKNNFCSDTSKITDVTVADLRELQTLAKQNGLVNTDLPDRSRLAFTLNGKPVAEGNVVRLVAWVQDAHLSDCKLGEEVNCKISGSAHSDIHIVLVDPASGGRDNQDECSSVTAEMSPHFRPAAWSQLNKKIPTDNVIRVTGPLFFDNAHMPCASLTRNTGPKRDEPPFRSSLWEIHPVYQFEVCTNTDPKKCNLSDGSVWKAYDQWVKDPMSKTAATKAEEECVEPGTQAPGNVPAQCPSKH